MMKIPEIFEKLTQIFYNVQNFCKITSNFYLNFLKFCLQLFEGFIFIFSPKFPNIANFHKYSENFYSLLTFFQNFSLKSSQTFSDFLYTLWNFFFRKYLKLHKFFVFFLRNLADFLRNFMKIPFQNFSWTSLR